MIVTKNSNIKFKFVFDDSSVSLLSAKNYKNAAIVAVANRIRANKSEKLVGAWSKDEATNQWAAVVQNNVTITF